MGPSWKPQGLPPAIHSPAEVPPAFRGFHTHKAQCCKLEISCSDQSLNILSKPGHNLLSSLLLRSPSLCLFSPFLSFSHMCVCMCTYISRSDVFFNPPYSLGQAFSLSLKLSWPATPRDPPVSASSTLASSAHCHGWCVCAGRPDLGPPTVLYRLSHPPSPKQTCL